MASRIDKFFDFTKLLKFCLVVTKCGHSSIFEELEVDHVQSSSINNTSNMKTAFLIDRCLLGAASQ